MPLIVPAAAIPPLFKEGVFTLIGRRCRVPMLKNPNRYWWGKITDVRYVYSAEALVRITSHGKFGKPRDVALSSLKWGRKDRVEDPLIRAMRKAQFDRKMKHENVT